MATSNKCNSEKESLRKNLYFKNGRVRKAINEADNASDLVELAMLYYLDSVEKRFITREDIEDILNKYNKNVHVLDEKYTQVIAILNDIYESIFNNKKATK